MNNHKLLEMAAKAAGLTIDKSKYNGAGCPNTGFDVLGNAVLDWHNGVKWNPLTNDGDALRLATKLKIDLTFMVGANEVGASSGNYERGIFGALEIITDDIGSATRMAIVRFAAEIGVNKNECH